MSMRFALVFACLLPTPGTLHGTISSLYKSNIGTVAHETQFTTARLTSLTPACALAQGVSVSESSESCRVDGGSGCSARALVYISEHCCYLCQLCRACSSLPVHPDT